MGKLSLGRVIGGLGAALGGYATGQEDLRRDNRAEEDARIRREEADAKNRDRQQAEQARLSLAAAARPATIEEGAGGAIRPSSMDDRDVGAAGEAPLSLGASFRVGGQTYTNRAAAQQAADTYNSPDAMRTRQAAAMDAAGNPTAAMSLRSATLTQKSLEQKAADDAWKAKIGQAMQAGHDGLAQLVSNSEVGPMAGKKIAAVPSTDGKQVTYSIVNDDGTMKPTSLTFSNDQQGVVTAAYMLDRSIGAEHRMTVQQKDREIERKTTADEQRAEYQKGLIDTKIKQLELTGQVAEARALAAAARAGGGDKIGREERLRYTSLFSDSGRRQSETQKTINSLMKDQIFALNAKKPGSQEATQLQELRDELKSHKQDREMWQGLLAGSGATGDEKPAAASSTPLAVPKSKAELKKGKVYQTTRGPATWNGTAFEVAQ